MASKLGNWLHPNPGFQIVEEIIIPSGQGPGEKMADVADEDGVVTHKRVRFNPKSAEDSEPEI